jgi:hypothetical protein
MAASKGTKGSAATAASANRAPAASNMSLDDPSAAAAPQNTNALSLAKVAEGAQVAIDPATLPPNAKVTSLILESLGIEEVEPQVIHQFLELMYRKLVNAVGLRFVSVAKRRTRNAEPDLSFFIFYTLRRNHGGLFGDG